MRSLLSCCFVVLASCSSEGGGASSSAPAIKPEAKTSAATSSAPSAAATASAPAPETSPGMVAPQASSGPGLNLKPIGHGAGSGQGRGLGCPCGCDRSTEMASELATETELGHGDAAKVTLMETLTTIADREDGGYITEAMAQHRERMLSLAPSLFGGDVISGRGVAWSPDVRGLGAPVTNGALRVRVILSAHGEAIEIVRGKEKAIRSSFRLGMEIENLAAEKVVLAVPTIDAGVRMPVERWYLQGSSGARWNGAIGAREKVYVNAVGYLGEPVQPGTAIDATVTFESMKISTSTRAAGHWQECSPGPRVR